MGLRVSKYRVNWVMKSDAELKELYDTVMKHLRSGKYGLYFAIQEIFGVKMANQVAEQGRAQRPACAGPQS